MKKIILLALITLMTCTRGAGQSMFSGSTELEIIANEWENITLNGGHPDHEERRGWQRLL